MRRLNLSVVIRSGIRAAASPRAVIIEAGKTVARHRVDRRAFAAIDARLVPGTVLPAPAGVFPRYQPTPDAE